jgi:uncharacterized DUF497 family protein
VPWPSWARAAGGKSPDSPLYRLVAEHLETFLADAREHHDRGLPSVAVPDGSRMMFFAYLTSIALVLRVTVTERDDGETIRIISARKANESERRIYTDHHGAPP